METLKVGIREFSRQVTASTIAMLNDTCRNLIQLIQLARYSR